MKQVMDITRSAEIQATLKKAKEYLETTIVPDEKYRRLLEECKNKHESCAFWATLGEFFDTALFLNMLMQMVRNLMIFICNADQENARTIQAI